MLAQILKEAAEECKRIKPPEHASLLIDDQGIICQVRNQKNSYSRTVTWQHLSDASPGINPLLFAISHCQAHLAKLTNDQTT